MRKYKVTDKLGLASGHIELTDDQAKHRMEYLEPVKDCKDIYNIVGPIEFKAGEIVGLKPAAADRYIPSHTELVEPIANVKMAVAQKVFKKAAPKKAAK